MLCRKRTYLFVAYPRIYILSAFFWFLVLLLVIIAEEGVGGDTRTPEPLPHLALGQVGLHPVGLLRERFQLLPSVKDGQVQK